MFWVNPSVDLEGENVHLYYGEKMMAATGACSLKMLTNAHQWARSKTSAQETLKRVLEEYSDAGPCNYLVYVQYAGIIRNLESCGFHTIEILPGGHGKYEMHLMVYMHNPDAFTGK